MSKDLSIFENVQMFESASSHLLNPEECSHVTLEALADEVFETNPPYRNFTPWFVYQAQEYLELAIQKRIEYIKYRYCE